MMHDTIRFQGLGVALATPFSGENAEHIDLAAFRALVRQVGLGGADFIVVLGSTGEAATVSADERKELIRAALDEALSPPSGGWPSANGRLAVVAGTSSNDTASAAALTAEAAALGAHGALVATPYYNKPQPDGVVAHYRAIAKAAPGFPIIAYNVPGRTGLNMGPALVARLWEIPELVALKESSGNLAQIGEIARTLPPGKTLLSGDDALALPSIAVGAVGLVSVAANAAPGPFARLVRLALAGELAEARVLHQKLLPFMDALFVETNPAPIKAALAMLGLGGPLPRLPLVKASRSSEELVRAALRGLGPLAPSASGTSRAGAGA